MLVKDDGTGKELGRGPRNFVADLSSRLMRTGKNYGTAWNLSDHERQKQTDPVAGNLVIALGS